MATWDVLPPELWVELIGFVGPVDSTRLATAAKRFKTAVDVALGTLLEDRLANARGSMLLAGEQLTTFDTVAWRLARLMDVRVASQSFYLSAVNHITMHRNNVHLERTAVEVAYTILHPDDPVLLKNAADVDRIEKLFDVACHYCQCIDTRAHAHCKHCPGVTVQGKLDHASPLSWDCIRVTHVLSAVESICNMERPRPYPDYLAAPDDEDDSKDNEYEVSDSEEDEEEEEEDRALEAEVLAAEEDESEEDFETDEEGYSENPANPCLPRPGSWMLEGHECVAKDQMYGFWWWQCDFADQRFLAPRFR
jgi:hypothetical protein